MQVLYVTLYLVINTTIKEAEIMYLDYLIDVPEVETPEERLDTGRSSCLKAGAYMVISKTVKDMELDKKLEETLGAKAAGMILDFASYSIITEGNAAQYYSDYAYNHPLFTPDIKIYSDSTISDFFR